MLGGWWWWVVDCAAATKRLLSRRERDSKRGDEELALNEGFCRRRMSQTRQQESVGTSRRNASSNWISSRFGQSQ